MACPVFLLFAWFVFSLSLATEGATDHVLPPLSGEITPSVTTEGATDAIEEVAKDELKVAYLWKDSLIGQTIEVPHLLVALHHALPAPLPRLLLKPPFINGQKCSHTRDEKFFSRVEKILPPHTPFTIKKIFFTMSQDQPLLYLSLKWVLRFLSLMEWHKFRGGTGFYYLVEDKEGGTYIIDDIDIAPALFYRYLSPPAQKARDIWTKFQQKSGTTLKPILNQTGFEKGATYEIFSSYKENVKHAFSNKISITLEGHEEYIEKCQYYQSPEELAQKQETEIKEQQKSYDKIAELAQESPSDHLLKKQEQNGNTVEMQVNDKGLALLLLNSSFLRIKDIKTSNELVLQD